MTGAPQTVAPATLAPRTFALATLAPRTFALATLAPRRQLLPGHLLSNDACSPDTCSPMSLGIELCLFFDKLKIIFEDLKTNEIKKRMR
jgi:hypothetical protein